MNARRLLTGLVPLTMLVAGASSATANTVPIFGTPCLFSHRAADDPIVAPGNPGAAHSHDFFGSFSTEADSTPQTLRDSGGTSCHRPLDRAAYWVPTLYQDGVAVTPDVAQIYYRGLQTDLSTVQPLPAGLKIIAGNAHSTGPQPETVTSWSCSPEGAMTSVPTCPDGLPLRLRIHFPDCWDGVDLDSPDHAGHMAYSYARACPASHPVPVPRIELNVVYPTRGGSGVTLSSGAAYTAHADFMNGWDQNELERLTRVCINEAPSSPAETCTGPPIRDLPAPPTLAPFEQQAIFGQDVTLTGAAPAGTARPVGIQATTGGGWRDVASVSPADDGSYAVALRPTENTHYRSVSPEGRRSGAVLVSVAPRVTLSLRGARRSRGVAYRARAGDRLRAIVGVTPAKPLVVLRVERFAAGRWRLSSRRALRGMRGRLATTFRIRRPGRYRIRAATRADADHVAGRSEIPALIIR